MACDDESVRSEAVLGFRNQKLCGRLHPSPDHNHVDFVETVR